MYFGRIFHNRNRLVFEPEIDTWHSTPIVSTRVSDKEAVGILRRAKAVAAHVDEGNEFTLVLRPEDREAQLGSRELTVSIIEQAPSYGLHSTYVLDTEVGFKKLSPAPTD